MSADAAVIVGAGQAGAYAALALREAGFAGPIRLIGEETERPHERPPLSKQWLTAAEEPAIPHFHPESHYAEHGIELLCGTPATELHPEAHRVTLADGRSLDYGRLLLATGGRARRLSVPGAERALSLRTLDDARQLRGRLRPGATVVCIGAGVIGLEIASSACARGCAVTVIEAAPTVMARSLTPELSAWLAALHRKAGVRLLLGTGVAAILPDSVRCSDGAAIPAEIVVAGAGMARNTALAERAGLAVDNGIEVDEFGRTSVPDIYAAGDVAAFWVPRLGRRLRLESWRHAQDHGTAVGRAMAGADTPYDEVPWFWTDQHGRNLQMAGETGPVTIWRRQPGDAPFAAWFLDEANRVLGAVGVDSPREVRAAQNLIRAGRTIDPVLLADASLSPQRLVRG